VKVVEEERREEQEAAKKTLQQSLNEHINQWHQREQENRKSQNATLQQKLRKAETDLEVREQRLNESNRHCSKLQERVEVHMNTQTQSKIQLLTHLPMPVELRQSHP